MHIEFTVHALKRMEERDIQKREVELVVNEPEEEIPVKFSRFAAFRCFADKGLVVIYQRYDYRILEVVTAVWADRRRLKRYGFTRI